MLTSLTPKRTLQDIVGNLFRTRQDQRSVTEQLRTPVPPGSKVNDPEFPNGSANR